ncbi:MAG: SIS domain-containing protein [Patescibacteria group bacterium]
MNPLDKSTTLALDRSGVHRSIALLAKQGQQAWTEGQRITLPASYRTVTNVVICGMGGSGLGAHAIQFLFWDKLKLPYTVMNGYAVPGSVNKNTLFVGISYSGTTEEVLAATAMARRRGAKVVVIASGGPLGAMIDAQTVPGYRFVPTYNPSGQPRMASGYLGYGLLGILKRLGIVAVSDGEVGQALRVMTATNRLWQPSVPAATNAAKKLAEKLHDTMPVLAAADFLTGSIHAFVNQLHESAKNFAVAFPIPELNHHLLEGLAYPKKGRRALQFVFIQSKLYHPTNQRRIEITKEVVENNGLHFIEHQLTAPTKLGQAAELLVFGSYVSFYAARLNKVDPGPNPWVDFFKEQLAAGKK